MTTTLALTYSTHTCVLLAATGDAEERQPAAARRERRPHPRDIPPLPLTPVPGWAALEGPAPADGAAGEGPRPAAGAAAATQAAAAATAAATAAAEGEAAAEAAAAALRRSGREAACRGPNPG